MALAMRLGAEVGVVEVLGRPFSCGFRVESAGRAWVVAGEEATTDPGQRGWHLSKGCPGLPLRQVQGGVHSGVAQPLLPAL